MSENTITILHVEDDSVDSMVVQRAFKKSNIPFQLLHATDGAEALDMLRGTNGKPKLTPMPRYILLDINMPKMNGLEFLAELRKDSELSIITVFILTTSNDDRDRAEAYKNHVAGYILKPVKLENYVSTFEALYNYWQICVAP